MTDTVDSELPEDYDEAIALYAAYLAMVSVEKQNKATMCMAQYLSTINGLSIQDINDDS